MKAITRCIAAAHENSFFAIVAATLAGKLAHIFPLLFGEEPSLRFRNRDAGHHLLLIMVGVRTIVKGAY